MTMARSAKLKKKKHGGGGGGTKKTKVLPRNVWKKKGIQRWESENRGKADKKEGAARSLRSDYSTFVK